MLLSRCNTPSGLITAETSFLSYSDNVVYTKVNSYTRSNKNIKEAQEKTEEVAFETLLKSGIPNSPYNTPLISSNEIGLEKRDSFIQKFLQKKEYKTFVVRSTFVSSDKIETGRFKNLYEIGINVRALRTYLENKGVIRSFGL